MVERLAGKDTRRVFELAGETGVVEACLSIVWVLMVRDRLRSRGGRGSRSCIVRYVLYGNDIHMTLGHQRT